jgi:RNA polymerase-binding transcription factor DksA
MKTPRVRKLLVRGALPQVARDSRRESVLSPKLIGTPGKINLKWTQYYDRLLALHERLLRDKAVLTREAQGTTPTYSMDMADAATDEFDRDMALSALSAEQDALYEIEEALRRIQNNTYGICELTGKPIPAERLRAVPWTRFTEEAEAKLEKQQAVRRPKLGAVASVKAAKPTKLALTPDEIETGEARIEDLSSLEVAGVESEELETPSEEDEE